MSCLCCPVKYEGVQMPHCVCCSDMSEHASLNKSQKDKDVSPKKKRPMLIESAIDSDILLSKRSHQDKQSTIHLCFLEPIYGGLTPQIRNEILRPMFMPMKMQSNSPTIYGLNNGEPQPPEPPSPPLPQPEI